ncbi:hypothetical protein Purlil1_12263 [Purpureocillium lilacinum]|uniref:Uncharacterized protein n=1 Tax=Purpureocillium lilacinum TaxID=33203 RepID=A0ABR0BHA5_PURLI|nr:hypothetical protein Purlil1_12263 [Purpureocillium lilacinum]
MAEDPYFDSITSTASFAARFAAEGRQTLSDLQDCSPASDWGRKELFAYRVRVRRGSQSLGLPALIRFIFESDLQSSAEICRFIAGPADGYITESEHHLIRKYGVSGGQVWAAMATFCGWGGHQSSAELLSTVRSERTDENRPKRTRKNTMQEYYVSSDTMQVGSSSPIAEGSQGSASVGYVDSDAHGRLSQPEDATLRFASCVLRHILYFGPPQASESLDVVVEFRDARLRFDVTTPRLERRIVATDDGGLCLREKSAGVFELTNKCLAILEAKKRFQRIIDGRPIISDTCLGQMTCEALAARLADSSGEFHDGSVFVIHATQRYMCFLQFEISDEYLDDFESTTPTSFIYVNSTPWYDLNTRSGREHVVANSTPIALARWWNT